MTETPGICELTEATFVNPTLVIFDDDPVQLVRFKQRYEALHYSVTAVWVPKKEDEDLVAEGKIKHEITTEEKANLEDWRVQDRQEPAPRTWKTALAEEAKWLEENTKTGDRHRYNHQRAHDKYAAIGQCDYGIKTPEEARNLLRTLKPDCILSDNEMRDADDVSEGTALMGTDIMALAASLYPTVPRAMHTSLFSFADDATREEWFDNADNRAEYERYQQAAAAGGYCVKGKDKTEEWTHHSQEMDAYFRQKLARGQGEALPPP